MWMITALIFLLHFVFGFSTGFIGAIMPALLESYQVNMVQGSYVLGMINAAGLASVLILFFWGDRLNKFFVIGVAFLLFTLSLGLASVAPTYGIVLGVFFLFGLGIKTFDTMNNAVISDLHAEKRGLLLNLMHAGFSVGALTSPQYVLILERNGYSWTSASLFFGFACLIIFILYVLVLTLNRMKRSGVGPKQPKRGLVVGSQSLASLLEVTKSRELWFLTAIFFAVFGVISITNTWLVYYFESGLGSNPAISKSAVTAFWLGVLLSRTVIAPIALKFGSIPFIRNTTLFAAGVLIAGLLIQNEYVLLAGIFISGLTAGQINPFVIAKSCALFPDRSAAVNAFLFLIAYISQIFFPWFSGLLGELFGGTVTMFVMPVSFILVSVFAFIVVRIEQSKNTFTDK